jgi:hypothetical protein
VEDLVITPSRIMVEDQILQGHLVHQSSSTRRNKVVGDEYEVAHGEKPGVSGRSTGQRR